MYLAILNNIIHTHTHIVYKIYFIACRHSIRFNVFPCSEKKNFLFFFYEFIVCFKKIFSINNIHSIKNINWTVDYSEKKHFRSVPTKNALTVENRV